MHLVLKNVKKKFLEKEVLKGIDFSFEKGKIYGLLGRNGAGKTTLFNCISEDIKADDGKITVEEDGMERNINSSDIGYVLSTPVVPEFLTAGEFLKFFLDINKPEKSTPQAMNEYFELMKIAPEDRNKLMKDYSHGMKNKMQMLVNFIADPAILLLDEPLTSFDVVVADEMKQLLRSLKEEHIIIFSTHILELALDLCDEIVILNDGVLEGIEKEHLDNAELKEKIIAALRGDVDA